MPQRPFAGDVSWKYQGWPGGADHSLNAVHLFAQQLLKEPPENGRLRFRGAFFAYFFGEAKKYGRKLFRKKILSKTACRRLRGAVAGSFWPSNRTEIVTFKVFLNSRSPAALRRATVVASHTCTAYSCGSVHPHQSTTWKQKYFNASHMKILTGLCRLTTTLLLLLPTAFYAPAQALKGHVELIDPSLEKIIARDAAVDIIAEGLDWCEGPLWVEAEKKLLFSDVPQNKIYQWTAARGKELYLSPSGYTGTLPRGGELGSNGLTLDNSGHLIICQDGDRTVSRMNSPIGHPYARFTTLASRYQEKKFNSPNDLIYNRSGDLFFTDPPYGLEKNMDDPLKEIPFQGVYKNSASGKLTLLLDSISRPNGIALTPDGKTLMIANSDPGKPYWYAYSLSADGRLSNGRIFYDASREAKTEIGLPDGMKIDSRGNIFATGPGGVWIFNAAGKLLGKIRFDGVTSNCALTKDEKTLFITADMYVLRVKLR